MIHPSKTGPEWLRQAEEEVLSAAEGWNKAVGGVENSGAYDHEKVQAEAEKLSNALAHLRIEKRLNR